MLLNNDIKNKEILLLKERKTKQPSIDIVGSAEYSDGGRIDAGTESTKGSVALTEQFAHIYTFESPGGWNILGNTPLDVFNSSKEDKPNLINPGDTVIFKEITLDQYKNYNE